MLYEHHAVSFTLGHRFFQDKILQSFSKNEEIQVTNDGATILKSIGVDNPAAKILVGKKKHCDSNLQSAASTTTNGDSLFERRRFSWP